MDEGLKIVLTIIGSFFLIAGLLMGGHAIWFSSLPISEQNAIRSQFIEDECKNARDDGIFPPKITFSIQFENGTYSPYHNSSKLCYPPPPDPRYVQTYKVVTVAGYDEKWFGDCRIVTTENEIYNSWNGDPCIKLTPGNTVGIIIGKRAKSVDEQKIISATILGTKEES